MLRGHTFVAMMGVAAVLSLARSFVVALLLLPVDFGLYATIVALAVFLSPIFGLGQIELARKAFPRLFVDGQAAAIAPIADKVCWRIGLRIGVAAAVCTLAAAFFGGTNWALVSLSLAVLAFGSAWILLLASALRAGPDVRALGQTTLLRAVLTLTLASLLAWLFGLSGALAGEVLAVLLSGAAMRWRLSKSVEYAPALLPLEAPAHELQHSQLSTVGLQIALASLAVSIPLYLSRPAVGLALGGETLGTFSFLMIFVMGAITTYGIAEQMIGPSVVRWQHEGRSVRKQLRSTFAVLAPVGLAIAGAILAAFAFLGASPLSFFTKYRIDAGLVAPVCIFAALHCTTILDWIFQANDREARQLVAATAYLLAFAVAVALLVTLNWPLPQFLWALAAAKLMQLGLQGFFLTAMARTRHESQR